MQNYKKILIYANNTGKKHRRYQYNEGQRKGNGRTLRVYQGYSKVIRLGRGMSEKMCEKKKGTRAHARVPKIIKDDSYSLFGFLVWEFEAVAFAAVFHLECYA